MIAPAKGVRILIALRPVDFRKGAQGLAALVQTTIKADPFLGAIFIFRAKRVDRLKLVYWPFGKLRRYGPVPVRQDARAGPVPLAEGRGRRDAAVAGAARGANRGARLDARACPGRGGAGFRRVAIIPRR